MDIQKELSHLNSYQREAVLDDSRACIVNANVGSGKTTVLISKLIYLHFVLHVPYEEMVVLTFTNKAADEIRERLLGKDESVLKEEMKFFGTFHSVALSLLKYVLPVETHGYTKEFQVITPEEELALATEIILRDKLTIKYKNRLLKRIEKVRAAAAGQEKVSRYNDDIFLLVEKLEEEKRKQDKMTFSDLLENAIELIAIRKKDVENHHSILSSDDMGEAIDSDLKDLQNVILNKGNHALISGTQNNGYAKPSWLIIDEVQDSDEMQLKLLDSLMGENTHLFAVGDPNQVIYSWRGSAFQVFYKLKETYHARELSLPINYRSSGTILNAAKYFQQKGEPLQGDRESGQKIVVKRQYNSFQEADYLAGRIRELHEQGIPYGEIAIFYRLQSQSGTLEKVLKKNEIPVQVSMKRTMLEYPVMQWFVSLLRAAVYPKDYMAAVVALSHKEYGFGTVKKAEKCIALYEQQELSAQGLKEMYSYYDKIRRFSEVLVDGMTIAEIEVYFEISMRLHPTRESYVSDYEQIRNFLMLLEQYYIEELQWKHEENVIKKVVQEGEKNSKIKYRQIEMIREFLNQSALYGLQNRKQEQEEQIDCVHLMTLHASKGLEFSHVFLIGVNQGLIPLHSAGMEAEEEEQRLFFVGMTRAKDYLELSYYTNPDTIRTFPGESTYLKRIPKKLIEYADQQARETVDLQELKRQVLEERRRTKLDASKKDVSFISQLENKNYNATQKKVESNQKKINTNQLEPTINDILNQQADGRKCSHPKYGEGTIVKEDEMMITVSFKNYGEKEFLKALSGLTMLS